MSLCVYGILHFLVDGVGAVTVFTIVSRDPSLGVSRLLLVYGLISFAARPFMGLLVDVRAQSRVAALFGSLLVALAPVVFANRPLTAAIALGMGNALFHVGAGSICFRLKPGCAGPSGLFAAPGAVGVAVGALIGVGASNQLWVALVAIPLVAAVILFLPEPLRETQSRPAGLHSSEVPVLSVLISIALLSFFGLALRYSWQSTPSLAMGMVAAVAIGRASGGLLADQFGWRLIALGGPALAVPLLVGGGANVACGVLGVALLNLALPVASTSVFSRMQDYPAFSFGLVSLALIAGGLPSITGIVPPLAPASVGVLAVPVAWSGLFLAFSRPFNGRWIKVGGAGAALLLSPHRAYADVVSSPLGSGSAFADFVVGTVVILIVSGLSWMALRAIRARRK